MAYFRLVGPAHETRLGHATLTGRRGERGEQTALLLFTEQGVMPSATPCAQQRRRTLAQVTGMQIVDRTRAPAQCVGDLGGWQLQRGTEPQTEHALVVGFCLGPVQ